MDTDFSAKESSLGYFYQIRYSLLLLLECERDDTLVRLESLDDIDLITPDTTNLLQTKLHINSKANITDASPDFWKTIRVWSESILQDRIDIEKTVLTLITTADIGTKSFLSKFATTNEKRNVSEIRDKMINVAETSTNKTNEPGYTAFKKLSKGQQNKLIGKIKIIDSSPSIIEALEPIKKILRHSTLPKYLDSFIERLEGWWLDKCIQQLCNKIPGITYKELNSKIADIRESFQTDNLPDDFANPLSLLSDEDIENHEFRVFVQQLKLISIGNNSLKSAINDFNRAYEQRSKWIREELLNSNEEELFENRLLDNWQNVFNAMKDDCEGLSPTEIERIGKDFYNTLYVNRVPPIRIREKFQSEYMTRGSCHILSDKKRIGWHPNFEELLNN